MVFKIFVPYWKSIRGVHSPIFLERGFDCMIMASGGIAILSATKRTKTAPKQGRIFQVVIGGHAPGFTNTVGA